MHRNKWVFLQNHSLAYLPIPKNANTWMKTILLANSSNGDGFFAGEESPIEFLRRTQVTGIHHYGGMIGRKGITRITVIRDPKSRLVSAFLDKFVKKYPRDTRCLDWLSSKADKDLMDLCLLDLLEALAKLKPGRTNRHLRPQAEWIRKAGGPAYFDHIGRFDSLWETERYLESRGLEIPSIDFESPNSKRIFKTTSYLDSVESASDLSIGRLIQRNVFPEAESFFGPSESLLFNQIYNQDIDLWSLHGSRGQINGKD